MNYMLEKINKLEKSEEILTGGDAIVEMLLSNENLNDSEKLMTIEYAVAKLNNILYHVSGDEKK